MQEKQPSLVRNIVPVLGITVDSTSVPEALKQVSSRLEYGSGRHKMLVVTPNPEIILRAQVDEELAKILNMADLALPDGVGVAAGMKYLSLKVEKTGVLTPLVLSVQGLRVGFSLLLDRKWVFESFEPVPGRVVFEELMAKAAQKGWKVFLVGGQASEEAVQALIFNLKFSIYKIKGSQGPWVDSEGKPVGVVQRRVEEQTIEQINAFKPDLLFVGFGAPKQEKWLARNLPRLNVKVGMVVGGAFDYTSGRVPKPPEWLTQAGFEWLWRLVTQPWRVGRIFRAVVVFPLKVYGWRMNRVEE